MTKSKSNKKRSRRNNLMERSLSLWIQKPEIQDYLKKDDEFSPPLKSPTMDVEGKALYDELDNRLRTFQNAS